MGASGVSGERTGPSSDRRGGVRGALRVSGSTFEPGGLAEKGDGQRRKKSRQPGDPPRPTLHPWLPDPQFTDSTRLPRDSFGTRRDAGPSARPPSAPPPRLARVASGAPSLAASPSDPRADDGRAPAAEGSTSGRSGSGADAARSP